MQGRSPDTPGGPKNISGFGGIHPKGRQAINVSFKMLRKFSFKRNVIFYCFKYGAFYFFNPGHASAVIKFHRVVIKYAATVTTPTPLRNGACEKHDRLRRPVTFPVNKARALKPAFVFSLHHATLHGVCRIFFSFELNIHTL